MVDRQERSVPPGAGQQADHSHDIYTVANTITVLRLILVPFAFAVLINGKNDVTAFVLFALAASTDWLDGQIARRTGTVTAIGKAIDPLVDRLLLASGVIGLYIIDRLPAWVMAVLVVRDAYLLWGAWRMERHHRRIPVTFAGKTTTFVLLSGFSLMILGWPAVPVAGGIPLGLLVVYAGVALSVATALQYTFIARKTLAAAQGENTAGSAEGDAS